MTIRELCHGDIVAVDTNESGELVGRVQWINIGPTQGTVGLTLAGGRSRTVIVPNDADAFHFVPAAMAREFRANE